MDLQIELYTTPTVEGRKILSSKGFVCANIVLGASEITEDYQMIQKFPKYMDKEGVEPYHVELFDALEREVLNKGGNAVIDLHIEHSYVKCGQYDYSLLISAQGTAVVVEGAAEKPTKSNINGKVLEQQVFRKHILTKLKEWYDEYEKRTKKGVSVENLGCYISDEEWVFVCRYPDISYAEYMHFAYTEGLLNDRSIITNPYTNKYIYYSRFFKYFKKLPYEKQIELAYKYCNQQSSKLIEECDLFDAKHILEWAQKGELGFAADCLKARKKKYCAQDLEDMQELYDFFVNLPEDKIEEIVEEVKSYGIRRYLCKSCDREFNISEKTKEEPSYCEWCKKGKKGLTKEQEERVKEFGIKIEALKELLSCNN